MIESAFLEFISLMKDMAPSVWDILIKQVYLEAVIKLVWALVWIFVGFGINKFMQVMKSEYDKRYSDDRFFKDDDWRFLIIPIGVSWFISFCYFINSLQWFINPEFYAIRFLIQSLTN